MIRWIAIASVVAFALSTSAIARADAPAPAATESASSGTVADPASGGDAPVQTSRRWDPDSDEAPGVTFDRAPASPASPAPIGPPPRFFLVPRFGTMAVSGSSSSTHFVPSLGLGAEFTILRWLGVAARYDLTYSNRGTSEVGVRRVGQLFTATVDGRVHLGRVASFRAGIGPGGALALATVVVPSDRRTAVDFEPGLAWTGTFDVLLPSKRVGFLFGASGLLHASSHDVLYFAGIALALDRPSPPAL